MALSATDAVDARYGRSIHRNPDDIEAVTLSTIASQPGWRVTLNSATIEEIVINAHDQVDEPSVAQLLDAFVFYVDNEEFILL